VQLCWNFWSPTKYGNMTRNFSGAELARNGCMLDLPELWSKFNPFLINNCVTYSLWCMSNTQLEFSLLSLQILIKIFHRYLGTSAFLEQRYHYLLYEWIFCGEMRKNSVLAVSFVIRAVTTSNLHCSYLFTASNLFSAVVTLFRNYFAHFV